MLLSIFKPVAVTFYIDRGAVMQNSIQNSRRDNMILEYVPPFAIGLVRCKDQRAFLIAPGYKLKEAVRAHLIEWHIPYLVYDQYLEL